MSWQMIGQEQPLAILSTDLANSRLHHAYLLIGPANIGKSHLALQLAQALNCIEKDRPCQKCVQCVRIYKGLHADVQTVTLVQGEKKSLKDISIAQIREVERTVALKPFEGRTRTIIINPAEAMNMQSQNAFLKTLEEPPPDVVFILATSRAEALLKTIRSRCREIQLQPLPLDKVEADLRERLGLTEEKAHLLARLSRGRPGMAITLASKDELLIERNEIITSMCSMSNQSISERFKTARYLANQFSRDRQSTLATIGLWHSWWRDILLTQSGAEGGVDNIDYKQALHSEARCYSKTSVTTFLKTISLTVQKLNENVNPRLALEAMVLMAPTSEES